jgi:ABC-type nitrate/sulfonate/bicarbonate transport system substrate-binding protein
MGCSRALIFVLLILFATTLASTANGAEPKTLNVGWTGGSAWTALPDRVAMERGFFDKEGLRVRYIQFQGTNLMLSALMANELDYVTILPFIAGAATRGLPVKIVAATVKTSGYAIVSRPDIDSIKALKGKRIAINTFGSSADFAIYQLLSPQRPRSQQGRHLAGGRQPRCALCRSTQRRRRCHRSQ